MAKATRRTKSVPPPAEKPTQKERAVDFVRRYANTVQIESTAMDFRIRFGEFEDMGDHVLIREVAAVSMSPQLALNFSNLLLQSVQKYMSQLESISKAQLEASKAPIGETKS